MNIARAEIAYPQFAAPGYVPTPNCAECATLANAPGMPEIKLPFEKNLYETKNGFLYPASATRYLAAPSAPLPTAAPSFVPTAANNWGFPTFQYPNTTVQTSPSTWFDTKKIVDSWGWNFNLLNSNSFVP